MSSSSSTIPTLSSFLASQPSKEDSSLVQLVSDAQSLFQQHFSDSFEKTSTPESSPAYVAVAPGRVNLIGEHTDYTGGFVLPLAIEACTVIYGKGRITKSNNHQNKEDNTQNNNSSSSTASATVRFVSTTNPSIVIEERIDLSTRPLPVQDEEARHWKWYVVGTVAQYLPDLVKTTQSSPPLPTVPSSPDADNISCTALVREEFNILQQVFGKDQEEEETASAQQHVHNTPTTASFHLDLTLAIAGNVPLGSGLSSSASLEVAVARWIECILGDEIAFASCQEQSPDKVRALRCQRAENKWCHSPCGIMDQYVSSAGAEGSLLLIDCTSLEFERVVLDPTHPQPTLVVCNSMVQHDIGGGAYPIRVAQCQQALKALQTSHPSLQSLREATLEMVQEAQDGLDEVIYRRAKHVVTENERTLQAKEALIAGDWQRVGELMNASHTSMRDDYEVSCDEIDILVQLAQSQEGVYGSRLTGGGFGGCTVTLVTSDQAEALVVYLKSEYKTQTGLECECFATKPGPGARVLARDRV